MERRKRVSLEVGKTLAAEPGFVGEGGDGLEAT